MASTHSTVRSPARDAAMLQLELHLWQPGVLPQHVTQQQNNNTGNAAAGADGQNNNAADAAAAAPNANPGIPIHPPPPAATAASQSATTPVITPFSVAFHQFLDTLMYHFSFESTKTLFKCAMLDRRYRVDTDQQLVKSTATSSKQRTGNKRRHVSATSLDVAPSDQSFYEASMMPVTALKRVNSPNTRILARSPSDASQYENDTHASTDAIADSSNDTFHISKLQNDPLFDPKLINLICSYLPENVMTKHGVLLWLLLVGLPISELNTRSHQILETYGTPQTYTAPAIPRLASTSSSTAPKAAPASKIAGDKVLNCAGLERLYRDSATKWPAVVLKDVLTMGFTTSLRPHPRFSLGRHIHNIAMRYEDLITIGEQDVFAEYVNKRESVMFSDITARSDRDTEPPWFHMSHQPGLNYHKTNITRMMIKLPNHSQHSRFQAGISFVPCEIVNVMEGQKLVVRYSPRLPVESPLEQEVAALNTTATSSSRPAKRQRRGATATEAGSPEVHRHLTPAATAVMQSYASRNYYLTETIALPSTRIINLDAGLLEYSTLQAQRLHSLSAAAETAPLPDLTTTNPSTYTKLPTQQPFTQQPEPATSLSLINSQAGARPATAGKRSRKQSTVRHRG